MINQPLKPVKTPVIPKRVLTGMAVSVSPCVITLPAIPAYGRYLAVVTGWFGNSGDRAYAWYLVDYFKAATSSAVGAAQQLGATILTPGQQTSAMTLSAPSAAGVMTVTLTSTRGNSQGNASVELVELSGLAAQLAV